MPQILCMSGKQAASASQALFCFMLEDGEIASTHLHNFFQSELFIICSLSLVTKYGFHMTLNAFELEGTWFCQT